MKITYHPIKYQLHSFIYKFTKSSIVKAAHQCLYGQMCECVSMYLHEIVRKADTESLLL